MNYKALISIAAAACLFSLSTGCGTDKSSSTASESSAASEETSTSEHKTKLTAVSPSPKISTVSPDEVKVYKHSNKAFTLKDCTTSIFMENGWEILSGGTATEQQTDEITSFPAVVQYLDTKTTLTITVADESEDRDSFLAGTEETYIAAYGSAYDSIDITSFKQLSIDEFDSFIIKADVVIKGESFAMTHILSNDVSGKSYSWMLLDSDGKIADFDLAEAICYPKVIDTSKFEEFEKYKDIDLDSLYKVPRGN